MTTSPVMSISDELLAELENLARSSTVGRVYDRLNSAGGGIKYHCYGDDGSIVLQVDHKSGDFGFIGPKGEEDERFFLACKPETILSLLAEREQLKRDAQRMQWVIAEQCIMRVQNGTCSPHVYSLWWPTLSEGQSEWYPSQRAAIDAAMQS